jgi:ribosomal protein S18 acetylase RimI-like enzyme
MTLFADPQCVSYFKRFRMELDLAQVLPVPCLPASYAFLPWNDSLLQDHADTLYSSFRECIDSVVFPSLGNPPGCFCLMTEISRKSGFLPNATWLLGSTSGYCGTVQGVCELGGVGAIQNLGITPEYRGRGLGTLLLLQALNGFRNAGLNRALLEVTAQNEGAIRLYRRLGFRRLKTVYKAVPVGGML